jgi:predicted transcriptional regulator
MGITDTKGEGEAMKSISIRMPDELVKALREKAARETLARDRRVSINELVVEILTKGIKADKKGGGR